MYKLNVTSHFSSAHHLVGYDGPCKELHGHNWKVRVALLCDKIDSIGMAIDFTIVKKHLEEQMNELDHRLLNDLPAFQQNNPTSENIAKYLYDNLLAKFSPLGCKVSEVEVWESEKSSVVYYE